MCEDNSSTIINLVMKMTSNSLTRKQTFIGMDIYSAPDNRTDLNLSQIRTYLSQFLLLQLFEDSVEAQLSH